MSRWLIITKLRFFLPLACFSAFLGCHSEESKKTGQALANVDGKDITVHQVNAELRASPSAGTVEQMQQRALQQVIDRELLAAQAVQAQLDRDPVILMAIERSRAQILSQAFLQSRINGAAKPSSADVDSYTSSHPELFVNRKVYNLRYLALPGAVLNAELTALAEQSKSLDEVATQLRARNVTFVESQALRSTAELPPQLLKHIDMVTKQPVFIMRDGGQALLASLTYVKDVPVTGEEATRQATQFLSSQSSMKRMDVEVARLRQAAKITYAQGNAPTPPPANIVSLGTGPAPKAATESGVSGLR